jgi:hypothetical protein
MSSMAQAIDRIQAKVNRAKKHVDEFHDALSSFVQTEPYAVLFKDDLQTNRRHWYVARLDPVPLDVESIAADALGNLREALDHIAYQLELAACGTIGKRLVYYPIGDTATAYNTNRRAYIQCARQAVIDAFDATEPYRGGKGEALGQINALKKSDKHHLLVATMAILGQLRLGGVAPRSRPPVATVVPYRRP